MAKTINGLTETETAATGDFLAIWRAANSDTRKITKANFLGATFTGGGTIATGGFTLTVPKTGTAAVGTGTVGRIAEWVTDANTLQASTLVKSGAGVLTLSAASAYTLTVPATGTAALLTATQVLSNKTLVSPTIADLSNAQHMHRDNGSGGRLASAHVLGDNEAISLSIGAYFMLCLNSREDSTVGAIAFSRIGAGPFLTSLGAASNTNITTGALTGTTGADGKFTMSAHSDGNLYLENRRGSQVTVQLVAL